jgi:hypothetical protein
MPEVPRPTAPHPEHHRAGGGNAILDRLGIPRETPTAARARDPTDDDARNDDDT